MFCNSSTRIARHSTEQIIPKARRKLRGSRKGRHAAETESACRPTGIRDFPPDGRVRQKALDIALNELVV